MGRAGAARAGTARAGTARRTSVAAASLALIVAAALVGCSVATPVPPPLTADDVQAIRDAQNADWWLTMFPSEPVPEIETIAEVAEADVYETIVRCVIAAGLPGIVPDGARGYLITDEADTGDLNRAYYRCAVEYPTSIEDPATSGYFSSAQLSWLYDYYAGRLVPCLRLAGFQVGTQPARADFVDSVYGGWSPYFAMSPSPTSAREWKRVDLRCPPPPFGVLYRPGDDPTTP